MFIYDKKRVNREIDELKKMLAITKGVKRQNQSVSATFLREDVDLTAGSQTPDLGMDTSAPADMSSPEVSTKTDDIKEIEKAIINSTVTSVGPMSEAEGEQVVKGYVSATGNEKALYFKFSSKDSNPIIQTSKATILDDDLLKSIEQIGAYFETWKSSIEK